MRPKILLVDDSDTARDFESTLLRQSLACEVLTARDGAEGLQKALSEKPDLILLDVVMPKMDGFVTCEAMRSHDALKTVPIVMVTGQRRRSDVQTGYTSGCNAYLTKPVKSNELLQLIRVFLGPVAEGETEASLITR